MSNLPMGWKSTLLEQLAAKTKYPIGDGDHGQIKPSSYTDEGIPYIRVGDMGWGTFEPDGLAYIPESVHAQNLKSELKPGDILIAKTGATIGKCCLLPKSIPKANTSSSVGKVTVDSEITVPKWILYFFLSPEFKKQMWAVSHKTAQPGFNIRDLKRFSVPLAPLNEQLRIVESLDRVLAKVKTCRERLFTIPSLLKRFRKSVLTAACSGRLTAGWREQSGTDIEIGESVQVSDDFPLLPESWQWRSLESVCERIVDCAHSTPKWTESGRLCVRTTNFKPGFLDLSEVRYVSDATFNERIDRLRPKAGDVLYSREGGILGIACMIPPNVDLCLGQRMMLFRAKSDFTAAMLMHWLNSTPILRRVEELTGGSASPHLNVRDIKAFPVPVPPLAEQQEIVHRVETLFALADRIEARYEEAQKRVDSLTQSILAKAFRGELVRPEAELAKAEGRSFESAEELLARITTAAGEHGASRRSGKAAPAPSRSREVAAGD